jgi:PAS domain S-box-containing protein
MTGQNISSVKSPVIIGLSLGLVFTGFYLLSQADYLLFHSIIELSGVVVAFSVFIIAWNARRFLDNGYLLLIGIGFLFVSVLNTFHTLSYRGMGIFQDYEPTNLAAQFWIAARFLQALTLLAATRYTLRRLKSGAAFGAYAFATALIIISILTWQNFPTTFTTETGLTSFKIISEFVISGILFGAILLLYRQRSQFNGNVVRSLIIAMGLNIASEMVFTLYNDAYGLLNAIGHFLLIISYYYIYKALIETGISRPFDLLFRNLQESEQKLRVVTDFTYTWEYWVSPERHFIFMSPSCEFLTGYSREEFLADPELLVRIIHPDYQAQMLEHFNNAPKAFQDNEELEYRIITKSGRAIWLGHICRPVFDHHGAYLGRRVSNRDITHQKTHREYLQRATDEWQATFDAINDAVILLDNQHRIVRANHAFGRIFNILPAEAVGRLCHDIVHDSAHPHAMCPHARTMASGRTVSEELFEPKLDIYVEATTSPIIDQEGRCIGTVHIIKDINRRKTVEAEREQLLNLLENQRLLLQNTIDQLPSGIVVRDAEGELLMANNQVVNVLGPLPKNISEFDFQNCYHPDGQKYILQDWPMFRTVTTGETVIDEEVRVIRKDAEPMTVLIAAAPVRSDNGEIIAHVGVFNDITSHKQTEEQLQHLTQELEIRIRERTRELISAHDKLLEQLEYRAKAEASLRSLSNRLLSAQEQEKRAVARELHDQTGQSLTVVKLLLGKADQVATEELRPVLKEISNTITEIIKQVRNLSLSLRPGILDDLGLIPALEWQFKQLKEQAALKVIFHHDNLPELSAEMNIGIFRIIQEALTNVLRYAGVLEAEVEIKVKESAIILHISDRGKGFSAAELSAGSSTGLSAMRERATLLGGQFSVNSAPNQGTVVTVKLPLAEFQ